MTRTSHTGPRSGHKAPDVGRLDLTPRSETSLTPRSPGIAALLAVVGFRTGLPQLYNRQLLRAALYVVCGWLVALTGAIAIAFSIGLAAVYEAVHFIWWGAIPLAMLVDGASRASARPKLRLARWQSPLVYVPWVLTVWAVDIALILFTGDYVVRRLRIETSRMHPTLQLDEVVIADSLFMDREAIQRGDIVVATVPCVSSEAGCTITIVRRVVARGGDDVEFRQGALMIDGVARAEPYATAGLFGANGKYVVPADHLLLLPDQRDEIGAMPKVPLNLEKFAVSRDAVSGIVRAIYSSPNPERERREVGALGESR